MQEPQLPRTLQPYNCCLCGTEIPIENDYAKGHNSDPLTSAEYRASQERAGKEVPERLLEGHCCTECNYTKVVPARLTQLQFTLEQAEALSKVIAERVGRLADEVDKGL